MEKNINNKITQESQKISLQIDDKIQNLKYEFINNFVITNSEVKNIKKDLNYLPQKINNIQQIVNEISLLPNAFRENHDDYKLKINGEKLNIHILIIIMFNSPLLSSKMPDIVNMILVGLA